ncbi:MAG: PAS domain S-box protein [bacterium]|nr:PAS domain S-box protein [bacterium]
MKLNIATKLNLLTALLIVIVSIFLGWFFLREQTQIFETELEERVNTIINNLAYNSEYGLLVGDGEALSRLLEGVTREKDIAYARIENKEGKVVAQSGKERAEPIKAFTIPVVTKLLAEEKEGLGIISEVGEKGKEEIIGTVRVGVSLSWLSQKIARIKKAIFSVMILVILLSSLGALSGVRFLVTRPLRQLISGIEKTGRGDLSQRVELKTRDEMGELADSFNKMAEDLSKTLVSRDSLEKQVEERTAELSISNRLLKEEVAERKQAQEALYQSEQRYRNLIETARDGIFTLSEDGRITSMNSFFETLTGWPKDKWIGKQFSSLLHLDDLPKAKKLFQQVMEKKTTPIHELRILSKSGKYLVGEFISTPQIQDGKVIGILGIGRDITEKQKMEKELQKTQKLESIGFLAAGIAHDFNNILSIITLSIGLAKALAKPGDKTFGKLVKAEKACWQAADLTNQLFTFSRGGAPIKRVVSMAKLIKDSAELVLSGSNVRCEFSIPDDLWAVEVDQAQLNQVINNLIINADQAMPEGGVIKIWAENIAVGKKHAPFLNYGAYIKIAIKDQGIGISKEDLPQIFDPFFSTKEQESGLGLTTAYSIIKKHEGYIDVESELGMGTTFYLYLEASEMEMLIKEQEEDDDERIITGQGRVLIMDDEEGVRDAVAQTLKTIGYEIELAVNGHEAIKLYKKAIESDQPFDAVIMDLTIPGGMGGKETIKNLLKIDPEVKAIVSSGYSNDPIMANFREYGFSAVLAKPYKIKNLSETLNKVLKNRE